MGQGFENSNPSRDTALLAPLQRSAARVFDGDVTLTDLRRLSGGASQELWRFELQLEGQTEPLVLRRAPPGRGQGDFATIDLPAEANLIEAAGAGGVPVPAIRWRLIEEDGLGAGFVMTAVAGEALPQKILHEPKFAAARAGLARACGETLARLHAVAPASLPALPELHAVAQLKQLQRLYDDFDEPHPVLELAMHWLAGHAPQAAQTTLVHGDFRNGNLMIGEHGLQAVLDWELAHRGDPMEDLGWLCVHSWRFGEIDKPVGGFGEREDLFAGYELVAGVPVDATRVHYWQIFGSFKWAVISLYQAFLHLRGRQRSVELAAIGRRVSEAEIDLLSLLHPRASLPAFAPSAAEPDPLPSAADLLDAASEFLREQAAPGLPGRRGFHARVAANVVDIAAREARLGASAAAAELQRLQDLLGARGGLRTLNVTLCRGLRDATLSADTPGLVEHLWATTNARLAIDQPHYATYRRLTAMNVKERAWPPSR